MKYVRVYESDYEQEYITTYQVHCEHVANLQDGGFDFEGCIIKQADTIEELCDEFIGIDNSDYHFHFTELEKINGNYSYLNEEYKVFYGAIWTDKGLIYVAKMNDKGELELL